MKNSLPAGRMACIASAVLLALSWPPQGKADPAAGAPRNNVKTSTRAPVSGSTTPETSEAIIGHVQVMPASIFDLENPEEDGLIYRLANKVHITTRPKVIEQQLLFSPGEAFSPRLIQESERMLRSNRYIQDASIRPVVTSDGEVDVEVYTTDTWTLGPRISFSRSGGTNKSSAGIREMNLLGTGIGIEALYASNVDRDSKMLKLVDPNLGNSWYELTLGLEDNSDGNMQYLRIGKPFYSLDSTDANGLTIFNDSRIDSYYVLGEIAGQYRHERQSYEAFRGWSKGLHGDWVTRYSVGLGYDEHRFSAVDSAPFATDAIPEARKLLYPFFGIEWTQDNYQKTSNVDQIGRTEDRFLGTRVEARFGQALSALGSDRDAMLVDIRAQTGFGDYGKKSLRLEGNLATRIERGGVQDFALETSARYYDRQSEKRLLYASLSGVYGYRLDLDRPRYSWAATMACVAIRCVTGRETNEYC